MNVIAIIAALGAVVVASPAFFIFGRRLGRSAEQRRQVEAEATAEQLAKRVVEDAEREAENLRKSAVVAGKEELIKLRETFEQEARGRREEIEREERRLEEREIAARPQVRRCSSSATRISAAARATSAGARRTSLERERELEKLVGEERRRLEQLAGLSAQDAKAELIRRMEEEAQADAANRIREIRETAQAQRRARSQEDRRPRHPAHRRRAHRGDHRVGGVAAERRDEGTHHRPRGAQHPRLRAGHRRGRDHRRHAGHGGRVVLRSRCGAKWRAWRSRSSCPTAASIRGASRKWSRSRARKWTRRSSRSGEAGGVRGGRARPASRADQARRAHAVAHQLRAEHPPALQGSGVAGRHHGRRARARRGHGASAARCCTTSARCSRTSTRARTCSSAWRSPRSTARTRSW